MAAEPPETIVVEPGQDKVACDGGGGALGHPVVYYTFGTKREIECGYCGRRFVQPETAAHH